MNRALKGFVDVFAHPMANTVYIAVGGFNLGTSLANRETYWSLWNGFLLAVMMWFAWKDHRR